MLTRGKTKFYWWGDMRGYHLDFEAQYPPHEIEGITITSSETAKRVIQLLKGEIWELELPHNKMHGYPARVGKSRGRRISIGTTGLCFSLRGTEIRGIIKEIEQYFLLWREGMCVK